jgi:hypothetical protein
MESNEVKIVKTHPSGGDFPYFYRTSYRVTILSRTIDIYSFSENCKLYIAGSFTRGNDTGTNYVKLLDRAIVFLKNKTHGEAKGLVITAASYQGSLIEAMKELEFEELYLYGSVKLFYKNIENYDERTTLV